MPLKKVAHLKDADLEGKTVLMRVDFNVPLKAGQVADASRIIKTVDTIKFIIDKGAKLVLMSHLGRPKAKPQPELRLDPVALKLSELLGQKIAKTNDCIGPQTLQAKQKLAPGEVLLLENTRFHPGETANNPDFARELAAGCDLFVEEAFGCVHRAHASTVGVAEILPSFIGFLVAEEVRVLSKALDNPPKPFVLVVGGAKIDTKIGVIRHFLKLADLILVGGGLANTFLAAKGENIGSSLYEPDKLDLARDLLELSKQQGDKLILPTDCIASDSLDGTGVISDCHNLQKEQKILDIGPKSAQKFRNYLQEAGYIVWNGPVGLFETPEFASGSKEVASAIASSGAESIIGGGDTLKAVALFNLGPENFTHVSTGGGAMLEFLEGKILPGLKALKKVEW